MPDDLTVGMLAYWSGALLSIPPGWQVADGTNGTPDLVNAAWIGAGDTYAPGATGGSAAHTHSGTWAGHGHGLVLGTGLPFGSGLPGPPNYTGETALQTSPGGLPPYMALTPIAYTGG